MNPHPADLEQTRRQFLGQAGIGLGAIALQALLSEESRAAGVAIDPAHAMAPRKAPFTPRAKRVIYLFMAGGPSQLELFTPKPVLNQYHGQAPPASMMEGRRFAFLPADARLLGSNRRFGKWGHCGMDLSDVLPHHRNIVDDVCWVRSVATNVFNHGPAKLFMNTGFQAPGRPSLGSWVAWGLGSESDSLPGFVVLQSGPRGPRAGNTLWSSGFLPTTYQGVPFRSRGNPILNLSSPPGISREAQQDFTSTIGQLNSLRMQDVRDPEIRTRIEAYETAFSMQTAAPELTDLTAESKTTLDLYGAVPGQASFAANCLLARRMVERGVRFVQLYSGGGHLEETWDAHESIEKNHGRHGAEVDQPIAALLQDLEQRGLLEETLIVWGGEFGRMPFSEGPNAPGRNHNPYGFSMWLAGGGVRGGMSWGATDDFGFEAVTDRVHLHDLHATILHLLGFDHTRLTWFHQGRDERLTDVFGNVVTGILA